MPADLLETLIGKTMKSIKVTPDIMVLQFPLVNAFIIRKSNCDTKDWLLVDTGIANYEDSIIEKAEDYFGKGSRPSSIILTHGHFDHVGTAAELSKIWDIPIYAHELEIPYLTGQSDYPSGDSTVDNGLMAKLAPLYPHKAINLGNRVAKLPADGTVPSMPEWKWIHTPGHTPGHISLFREHDRVLIVGDAFTTTKQESAISVLTHKKDISGPPAYFTTDWKAAEKSVKLLEDLKPSLILPSHGLPMKENEIEPYLKELSLHFHDIAVPEHGKFVHE